MIKRTALSAAIAVGMLTTSAAHALDVTVHLKHESAFMLRDGAVPHSSTSMLSSGGHDSGDWYKAETSARFFLNGDFGEDYDVYWHADINLIYDFQAISDYRGHKDYSQQDYFREFYVGGTAGDWDWRLGKMQEVWGTADGIKLLDIINPTDFRELNQNTTEDARIAVFMLKGERPVGDSGNFQFIVSQAKPNFIPGLEPAGAQGHPFVMKGVDTITGKVNGFFNVAPALSQVASSFNTGAWLGLIGGASSPIGLVPTTGVTVDFFASNMLEFHDFDGVADANPNDNFIVLPGDPRYGLAVPGYESTAPGAIPLGQITQGGLYPGDTAGNGFTTNLLPTPTDLLGLSDQGFSGAAPSSAFEYMANATFATFNSFTSCVDGDGGGCNNVYHPLYNPGGADSVAGITTRYKKDYPDRPVNAGFRYRGSTDSGTNFSFNYFYHYSANPDIALSWHDAVTGEELIVHRAPAGDFVDNGTFAPGADGVPDLPDLTVPSLSPSAVPTNLMAALPTTILLRNSAGEFYGAYDPTGGFGMHNTNGTYLQFTETLHRVHSIGGSFDHATSLGKTPLVIRGEFLYDHNDRQPVIDRKLLAIGDLSNALKMEKADYFKYVLGAEVTVMTNLLVSAQFIQFINLDYVNESATCVTQVGTSIECSRYTADFPTLHMSNGLNKGYEFKEFYSLFLSKPFGEGQRGRWNNIVIYEEGGGWWNRLDASYSVSDSLIIGGEINLYWGDEDTTFGQFKDSSNIQLLLKYLIES